MSTETSETIPQGGLLEVQRSVPLLVQLDADEALTWQY